MDSWHTHSQESESIPCSLAFFLHQVLLSISSNLVNYCQDFQFSPQLNQILLFHFEMVLIEYGFIRD